MTEVMVTWLFTVGGVLLGSIESAVVSIYSIKQSNGLKKKVRRIERMVNALDSFYELEEEYIKELIELRTKNGEKTFITKDAIVKEMRGRLRDRDVELNFKPSDVQECKNIFGLS